MKTLLFFLLVSFSASAAEIPPNDRVIQQLSNGGLRGSLPTQIRLMNWNILKGERGEPWRRDFSNFSSDRNIVLVQEGYQSPLVLQTLQSLSGLSFYMANSFVWKGALTGVISGFAVEPLKQEFRRSPQFEPILNSPKMSFISYFEMSNGKPLVVVNVHGINFVGPEK